MSEGEIRDLTYSICKGFVEREIPDEEVFYDLTWKALESLPKDWEKKISKAEIKEKRLSILPEAVRSLVTPIVVSIVTGILSNFLYDLLKSKARQRKINKTTKKKINRMAIEIATNLGERENLGTKVASFVFEYFESR